MYWVYKNNFAATFFLNCIKRLGDSNFRWIYWLDLILVLAGICFDQRWDWVLWNISMLGKFVIITMCFLFSFQRFGVASSFWFHNYICEDFVHNTNQITFFFGSQLELLWVLFSLCIFWEGHIIVKIVTTWRPLPCEDCHNVKTAISCRPPHRKDHHVTKTATSWRPLRYEDHHIVKAISSYRPQRERCNEYFDVALDICWMFVGCWLFYFLWK